MQAGREVSRNGRLREDGLLSSKFSFWCRRRNQWMIFGLLFFSFTPHSKSHLQFSLEHLVIRVKAILRLLLHPRTWGSIAPNTLHISIKRPAPFPHDPIASPSLCLWTDMWTAVAEVILMKCDICRLWPPTKESEPRYPTFYRLQNISWPAFTACTNRLCQVS